MSPKFFIGIYEIMKFIISVPILFILFFYDIICMAGGEETEFKTINWFCNKTGINK